MRRSLIPTAVALVLVAAGCRRAATVPPEAVVPGPPAIPDTQPAVNASLFLGQTAFASLLGPEADFSPPLATVRSDGANSGVFDGPAPLGQAPVTGSAEVSLVPPLLWDSHGDLIAGCRIQLAPGLTKNCLAAVNAATLAVEARWVPPEQDLNLASAVIDNGQRILVGTVQGQLFVLEPPNGGDPTFRVDRQIDLGAHLEAGQGVLSAVSDADGNLWFASGGPSPAGPASSDTTVGYVTPDDQVVIATLPGQQGDTGLAVDQEDVYLATSPAGATVPPAPAGQIYDLTATNGQVQTVWHESYDAGTAGPGAAVILLGSQYLAVTGNADAQAQLVVFRRGPLPASHDTASTPSTTASTTTTIAKASVPPKATTESRSKTPAKSTTTAPTTSTTVAPATTPPVDPRVVCTVALFSPGASAVTTAAIGYSSGTTNSVIVTNGYDTPPPLASSSDDGPGNNMNQMPGGVSRVDVLPDGSGCRTPWTTPLRLKTAPILATTTGLIYGYTQDPVRAATGTYVWYFVAMDDATGRVVWQQRTGAGSTKNDNGEPTILGADGVLYQAVPLGLVWMRDVTQQP